MDEWPVNGKPDQDLWRKINTLLRIKMHIPDPEKLDDDEWAMRWNELKWAAQEGFTDFELK